MKPIICNSESVRAILDGRKTQTRRVVKTVGGMKEFLNYGEFLDAQELLSSPDCNLDFYTPMCPYGVPGEKLWVRETWRNMCLEAVPYCECETDEEIKKYHYIEYKADTGNKYPGDWDDADPDEVDWDYVPRWKSPIYMPRTASRITLEIKDVRVERVRSITSIDATAEGINIDTENFYEMWDSINAKRGYSYDTDPWVWVIEFEKLD